MNGGIPFEKMCEKIFIERGYVIKRRTTRTKDYGIDIIMRREDDYDDECIAVQCKNTQAPIGRPVLQKLHSAMSMHNYGNIDFVKGLVVSVNGFTADAKEWARAMNKIAGYKRFILRDYDNL
jgi:restriction system protein